MEAGAGRFVAGVRTVNKLFRRLILLGLDLAATLAAVGLAFMIRFAMDGRGIPAEYLHVYLTALPVILPVRVLLYYVLGLYSQVWAHASVRELLRVFFAVTVDSAVSAAIVFALPNDGFPRSVLMIAWFLQVGALGSIRLALRVRREWILARQGQSANCNRTLIYGAGDAGAILARELLRHPELKFDVLGFIDDDPNKQGYRLAGKPVLGVRAQLKQVVTNHGVTHLIIAMPSVKGGVIREVVEAGRSLGLQLKTLPGIYELVGGAVSVSQIRDVQIEDLLGRPEVKVDLEAIAGYLSDEVVLVTGAGGSIGSELCRQVGRFSPRQMLLLGHGENSIYDIDRELRTKFPDMDIIPIIADIQDEIRIRRVFEYYRPGVVFHAAAHKHVPMMEYNPEEAVKNNIFGTYNVACAAESYRAKRFVLISSDKAVNPTSVMGATKRAAECVVQSLARTSSTVFVAVRFGNVLGSRGSVVPLFQEQIAAGGPITVTDPQMVRFFMTIPEATQLVIQAASMGRGGEVFVLDMGKPVRILDLASDLIRLSGFVPGVDIKIEFTGIRPGEKLFEELLTAEEGTQATIHQRIFVARCQGVPRGTLQSFLERMRTEIAIGGLGNDQVRADVAALVSDPPVHHAVVAYD